MWRSALLLLYASVAAAYYSDPTPQCQLLTIPVTVSNVQQKNLTGPIDYTTNPTGLYGLFPNLTVSETFNISASLCAPATATVNGTRNSTLQILVHGASYNKTYWSGLKVPPDSFNGTTYSWVDYATSQGYHTLSIDRLCNGNSSHPDGADICQAPTQAAVIHDLVQRARNGSVSPASSSPRFTSIVYVGHSLGSELGAYYLNTYPTDTNISILTGYSAFSGPGSTSTEFSSGAQPARDTFPRFSTLDPTYLAFADPLTTRGHFYYGSYNPLIPALDYQGTGTTTFGEFFSFALGLAPQPNITVPVLVLNGQNDQIFCARTIVDGFYGYGGDCGEGSGGLTARTSVNFPNAVGYAYFNVPDTGHDINLHYSAPTAFAAAQRFLDSRGF